MGSSYTKDMLSIQVEGDLEERLKRAAAVAGDEPLALARRVLDRNLPGTAASAEPLEQLAALESFSAGLGDWVSKNVPPDQFADDDRDRLYRGRGE